MLRVINLEICSGVDRSDIIPIKVEHLTWCKMLNCLRTGESYWDNMPFFITAKSLAIIHASSSEIIGRSFLAKRAGGGRLTILGRCDDRVMIELHASKHISLHTFEPGVMASVKINARFVNPEVNRLTYLCQIT